MTDYFSKAPHLHDCKIGPHHDECTCGLAAARAEIERLTKERDKALAQMAMAFRLAINENSKGLGFIGRMQALTPAHARAALEAYGREKVREGMKRAAELIDQNFDQIGWNAYHAIVAEIEKV